MSDPATLLIADDDPGLRQSLERTLTREGYRVILASDGNAALERLQAGGVDLVLTDLKMPGLSGIELLRAVKAIAADVDVILLTAFGTVEEAVKAMKEGAYDFLTKPFQRAQLLRLIRQALERHGQGARREHDPRALGAEPRAVHRGELRGAARDAARVGAVRLREGRVHRRGGAEGGPLRARRRRHPVPRRGLGPLAGDPAQDPPGASGG